MSWAALLISIVALILTVTTCVAVTVLVSRALTNAFSTLDSMHARNGQQVSSLLDRLAAIRWEDLVSLRSSEEPEEGGFFAPGEREEVSVEITQELPWPRFDKATSLATSREEQELLDEDFNEAGEVRR